MWGVHVTVTELTALMSSCDQRHTRRRTTIRLLVSCGLLVVTSVEDDYEHDEERESRDELLHGTPSYLRAGAQSLGVLAC
jgi:hypothetical protein